MTPREVAGILVGHRAKLRRRYRDILAALPAAAFEAEWVKSRGAVVPIMNETFLRLHDRYTERLGCFKLVAGDPFALLTKLATVTERYGSTRTRPPPYRRRSAGKWPDPHPLGGAAEYVRNPRRARFFDRLIILVCRFRRSRPGVPR
jgi:hypothetical protein